MIDFSKDYDFPGPFEPMDNQVQRFNFLLNNAYALDLSEMGTGKTITALWAADYLMREYGGSVLIFAPLTILESVWRKTANAVFGDDSSVRVHVLSKSGNNRARRIRESSNSIYITNYESILSLDFRNAVTESDIFAIVIDEVTAFKHHDTRRSRFIRVLATNKVVWGLTATPMPNRVMNAYGIARAVRQDYKETMTRFRGRTHIKHGQWDWIPKPGALQDAYEILQPSIRVRRDDCYALPPQTTETRIVNLSDDAKRLYTELRKHAYAELTSGGDISVPHEAALRNKLLQVAGGAVYTSTGTTELRGGGREQELRDILNQTDEKVVIFVPFSSQLHMVHAICSDEGYSSAAMNGDTPPKERTRILNLFQRTRHPRVIVADPRVARHGINELVAASIAVWWLPVDSAEDYEQANGRLERKGQTKHSLVIQLCGTKLERAIYQRLEQRQSLQGVLLKAIEEDENVNETKRKAGFGREGEGVRGL